MICPDCGCQQAVYQMFSAGREMWCPDCATTVPIPAGEVPRRLQMLAEGRHDELRAEMREHLATLKEAEPSGST